MYSHLQKLVLISCTLVLANCAQQEVRKDVDAEVQAEPAHKSADLAAKSYEAIEQSPQFTSEQKVKLTKLIERTRQENTRIIEEDSKLKGVLIEAITASPYQAAQVQEIKGRLIKVNNQRIKNVMASLNEVEAILGRDHAAHELIYRELIMQPQANKQLQ